MEIKLYRNGSVPNKINKTLTLLEIVTGTMRNEMEVTSPVILMPWADSIVSGTCNYARIEETGRYYYLRGCQIVRNEMIEIRLKSDPLMSFKQDIRNIKGIVKETEVACADSYINSRSYVARVKEKTDIINFSNGLLENGEFILITAGG